MTTDSTAAGPSSPAAVPSLHQARQFEGGVGCACGREWPCPTLKAARPKDTPGRVGLARNRYHQYRWNGGLWQPGATTILRIQDALRGADGLINWSVDVALDAALDAIGRGQPPANAIDAAKLAVTAARDRGTSVHAGIEAMIRQTDYTPTPATFPYWYGWSKFLTSRRLEPLATEQMVINLARGYGGTIDLIAKLDGKIVQIDVKTGDPKPAHALQLAAYAGAEFMGEPDSPDKVPMPEFDAHYVLALMPDAPYYELVPLAVGLDEIAHFHYLAETYHKLRAWGARERPLEVVA